MNLILLPGNNKENRGWIDAIEHSLSPSFSRIAVHYYDHWWGGDQDGEINLEAELLKLAATVEEFDKYVIFAKYAGVLIALYGIFEGILDPEVCVFIGCNFDWGKERGLDVDNWLINYEIPTLFIQKEHDPMLSFKQLEEYLAAKNVMGSHLVMLPGEDDDYDEIEKLRDLTLEFYET